MLSYACQITGRSQLKTNAAGTLLRVSAALPTGNLLPLPHTSHERVQHQPQQQQQQIRWKHSERQIKRLFRNHPAILRVEKREGIDRTPDAMPPPQFEAVYEARFLPNGWSAPPGPDVTIPEYPFRVARTKNKPNDAAGFLPVYSNFRYVRLLQTPTGVCISVFYCLFYVAG